MNTLMLDTLATAFTANVASARPLAETNGILAGASVRSV